LDTNLNATDILISYGPSNIVLEAACVPGVRLAIIGTSDGFSEDPEVIKLPVDADAVAMAIADVLGQEPPDYSKFITKYLGYNDGKARVRITNLVKELLGNG
jgi:hypothetical protein